MGGGIEKGKKRKQKRTGKKKGGKKKYWRKQQAAGGNRETNPVQPSGSFLPDVVSTVLRAIQLLVEDLSTTCALVSSFFCARIKMWPRLEITTENYRQESFDADSTTCCKDTTEE